MPYIKEIFDFILHINDHLNLIIQNFGIWAYLILFLIIFAETGLVVTPFLPGDSLLFVIGTFCALDSLNIFSTFIILCLAAIVGDSVNYSVGRFIGPKVFKYDDGFFFKKQHLERTRQFYEKHGPKTIVLARFIPIVRTFAPFVAGVGKMSYARFFTYNVLGGVVWVATFVFGGYWFGNIQIVKKNFELVVLLIIFVSVLPVIFHLFKRRSENEMITKPSGEIVEEGAN